MIAFDEALRLVASVARPLREVTLPIADASGHVLARPVKAQVDSPRADVSVMDGYAVGKAGPTSARQVIGTSYPGGSVPPALAPGECVRVFTGAPVPPGTARVVIQEDVERLEEGVIVAESANGAPRFVRQRGSDFRTGDAVLAAGQPLHPRALVAAAAADVAAVTVWAKPRIALLATGDELVAPGAARRDPTAVPESVSIGVGALAEQYGGLVVETRRMADELAVMNLAAADALAEADLIVVTGGASVGEKDFAKAMFAPHGLDLLFSKVAMKPGKPVWLGRAGDRLVLGLPGNPTSAMVTARLLLAPLVEGLAGRPVGHDWREARLAGNLPACAERETFVRARSTDAGALPIENQDSGAQHPLAQADLLLRCPPHSPSRHVGEPVLALAF